MISSSHNSRLRPRLGLVALVRLDDSSTGQLSVSVCRIYDLGAIDNAQSLESVIRSKLSRPGAADSVVAAGDVLVSLACCWVRAGAGDGVCALRRRGSVVGVDGVAVVA